MKYRKKQIVVEASQWFVNNDHPADGIFSLEGEVVRFYRNPDLNDKTKCIHCKEPFHAHGWIDTLEGGHIVCPGDWIVTGVKGEHYPIKPDIFWETYDLEECGTASVRMVRVQDLEKLSSQLRNIIATAR